VLIAVLGTPSSPAGVLAAYQRAWVVTAALALSGGVVALGLLTNRRRRLVEAPAIATTSG
jgi:hypothetical protein